jgi:hypothetical protein
MAVKPSNTHKTVLARAADFDEQLWPINCLIAVLAAFAIVVVVATSNFDAPSLLDNGWTRVAGILVTMALLVVGVWRLNRKMLRRLQFCILVSLLFHGGAAVYLHETYLLVSALPEKPPPQDREPEVRLVVPEYHWQQIEQPEVAQFFESLLETESPRVSEGAAESVEPKDFSHEPVAAEKPKTMAETLAAERPDPATMRRAELPPPRRGDQLAGEAREGETPVEPFTREGGALIEPFTPSDEISAEPIVNPSDPQPNQTVQASSVPIQQQTTPALAAAQPTPAAMLPERTGEQRLATLPAKRVEPARDERGTENAALDRSATLARAEKGTRLPSSVVAAQATAIPVPTAGTAANRVETITKVLAVARSETSAPIGTHVAAADAAESAIGKARIDARAGQPRVTGRDQPTVVTNASAPRLARTLSGTALDAASAAERTPIPGTAVAPGQDGPPLPSVAATAGELATASGGNTANLSLQASSSHQKRQLAGLQGNRQSASASGAVVAMAAMGPPLPVTAGRRGVAAQLDYGGTDSNPDVTGTLVRSKAGMELPTAAIPAEAGPQAGTGGMTNAQGDSPSKLEVRKNAVLVERHAQQESSGSKGRSVALDETTAGGSMDAKPGAKSGPHRVLSADERVAVLAALWGGTLARSSHGAGVPQGLAAAAESLPGKIAGASGASSAIGIAPGVGRLGHRAGDVPLPVAAPSGSGRLKAAPSLDIGLPSRRAQPESEIVHSVPSRFLIERSGGALSINGVVSQPTEAYQQRATAGRKRGLVASGGNEGTEIAVEHGLEFFARMQFPDGHWSLDALPPGVKLADAALGTMQSDTAATGLALLTYLGGGYTHLDDKYRSVVGKGLQWLIEHQKANGDLFHGGSKYTWFYSHGIAAIALCEAYGMTQDPAFRDPARRAIDFIVKSQHPFRGGWRYDVRPDTGQATETDTSVTGWQMMALKSAQMAGLEVPAETFRKVDAWLDNALASEGGGRYMYNPFASLTPEQQHGRQPSLAMTAEAMLMRLYLGRKRQDPQLIAGAEYLKANLPENGTTRQPLRDCYYWYYATQTMFQMQGSYWTAWNERFRPLLIESQYSTGEALGSWHPHQPIRDRWGAAGGRIYITAMHLLMLEVYYRHLPLFRLDAETGRE